MLWILLFHFHFSAYLGCKTSKNKATLKERYEEGISLRSGKKDLVDSRSGSAFQIQELSSNRKIILTEGKAELHFLSYPENNSQVG